VRYDVLYAAWQGEVGGSDPETAYCRFVESGMAEPPTNPLEAAQEGWLLGSDDFVARVKRLLQRPRHADEVPQWRRLQRTAAEVVHAVAEFYGLPAEAYRVRRSKAAGRNLAAYLAHRRTTATLRELAELFGLGHPDSTSNLIRRAEQELAQSSTLRSDLETIEHRLAKT